MTEPFRVHFCQHCGISSQKVLARGAWRQAGPKILVPDWCNLLDWKKLKGDKKKNRMQAVKWVDAKLQVIDKTASFCREMSGCEVTGR